ncbi:hypothetical protein EG329_008800 [Mollisiaceae sp. DMI_Dod_QoI]|nr:hypothetical protein EG329_008800 [Helotiales sp. DMI_Dod_QoI]
MVVDNADDYRYFTLFRDQLLFEMTQFAQSDEFRTIILQASDIPSIRHTMIALAALGKTHSILLEVNPKSHPYVETPESKEHREYSVRQYAKGLTMMKHAIATGTQDLRTTLLTCLLIICIECLHGNFTMAGAQVSNGMALLRDWRKDYPNADLHPLGFSSPAPHVIEDSLVQMLGGLEISSYPFDDKALHQKLHQRATEEGLHIIRNMPKRFQSTDESRLYLELLVRRSKHWLFSLGSCFKPLGVVGDEALDSTPLASFASDDQATFFNDADIYPSTIYHLSDLGDNSRSSMVKTRQALFLEDFDRWKASFDALIGKPSATKASSRWKEQLLAFKSCVLLLKTIITGDEMIYDDYTEDMIEILDLAEAVLKDYQKRRNGSTFTIFQRSAGPAHFVGLHCRVDTVRRRALDLLESLPKTPALSDTLLMGEVVKWVIELEEKGMVDGQIPDYARVRNAGVLVDISGKEATMVCRHLVLTQAGPVEKEEKKMISC